MISAFVYIIIIIYIFSFFSKFVKLQGLFDINFLKSYFSNVEKVYTTASMSLYKADRSGENFLFAIKNNSNPVTLSDLTTLYEIAEKYHIHNKVFVTEYQINNSSVLYKKIKEYEIQVWNSATIAKFTSYTDTTNNYINPLKDKIKMSTSFNSSSQTSFSPIKTSDTSDDKCEIEEAFDPIQEGAFKTHGIFSIFRDKPDHL